MKKTKRSQQTIIFHHPPFKNYLCIWLPWVLVAALRIFSCNVKTLSCGMWDLVSWSGIEPRLHALATWSLSHWNTREVPSILSWVCCCCGCYCGRAIDGPGLITVAAAAGIVISVMGIPMMNDNRHAKLKALSPDYLLWVKLRRMKISWNESCAL